MRSDKIDVGSRTEHRRILGERMTQTRHRQILRLCEQRPADIIRQNPPTLGSGRARHEEILRWSMTLSQDMGIIAIEIFERHLKETFVNILN